jgi:ribonuclease T1
MLPIEIRRKGTGCQMTAATRSWRPFALLWAFLVVILLGAPAAARGFQDGVESGIGTIPLAQLPAEARETLRLIRSGGPFPYAKDGIAFGNRERLLPRRPHGYYREYTVRTPGTRDRGARRIISGQAGEQYYTDNHYRSFKRILE